VGGRIKQERREQGKLAPKLTRTRRKAWEPYADWILAQLDRRPDMYLRELQAAALEELDWQVSGVTLSRAYRALRFARRSLVSQLERLSLASPVACRPSAPCRPFAA
jgi:hypothetical protein